MKHTLILVVLFLIAQHSLSQSPKNEKNQEFVRFETPTVASFTKFIDHPVSLYNGTPDVNIPIYTLKDGAIEVPITLRYNTSGIKVGEQASWVGLGWNLNVGGVIVQNIVGTRDIPECFNGISFDYCSFNSSSSTYSSIPYRVNDKSRYDTFYFYATEGNLQPDAFYFSYPGYAGKFYIDYRTGMAHLLKKEKPIKINYDLMNETCSIITETGIIHNFTKSCKSYMNGNYTNPVSITYYLTNTKYPNGQEINYSYKESKHRSSSYNERQVFPMESPVGVAMSGAIDNISVSVVEGRELTLSKIETDNYKIEFVTSIREDLLNNTTKLDEIVITTLEQGWDISPKRFKFNYSYFISNGNLGNYYRYKYSSTEHFDLEVEKRRLKLLSVHEIIDMSVIHNKYSFEYYTPELPVKTSYASDYWGYYNGEINNNSLTPDLKYLLRSDLGDKLSRWQRYKANRSYHFESCLAGMLKKITYPTGGNMIYTYEPNQFRHHIFIPTKEEIRSELPQTIEDRNNESDDHTYRFELTVPTRCAFYYKLDRGLNSWYDVQDSRYTLTRSGSVYKTESINFPTNMNETYVEKAFALDLPAGEYTLNVDLPDKLGDQYGWNLKHGIFSMSVKKELYRNYSNGAGLRVAKVQFYESPSIESLKYAIKYEYPDEENNGILHSLLQFNRTYGVHYTVRKDNTVYEFNTEETEISSSGYSSSPYSTYGIVGYSKVKEIITGDSDLAGYKIYTYLNSAELGSTISVQIPDPVNGMLNSIYYYNNTSENLKFEIFNYNRIIKNRYCGVSIVDNFNRTPAFYNSGSQYVIERAPEHHEWSEEIPITFCFKF